VSGQVGFGSDRVSLTFLKNQIKSGSDPDGSNGFVGSGRVLPPLSIIIKNVLTCDKKWKNIIKLEGRFLYYKAMRLQMNYIIGGA
jgi:hypothetical protein